MPPPKKRVKFIIIICTLASCTTLTVARRNKYSSHASSAFISQRKLGSFSSSLCSASELDSAYEWLAESRALNEPSRNGKIRWFPPDIEAPTNREIDDDIGIMRMPLYPLGAVHIPHSGENHTIINIDPKNVKMSMVGCSL